MPVPGIGLNYRPTGASGASQGGLRYKPLSPLMATAAGGLSGLGRYLMALGAGQPQQAGAAFSSGLQDMGVKQRQAQADYRDQIGFDLDLEQYETGKAEKTEAKAAAAREKAAFDAAVDALPIEESEKQAIKAGVVKYEREKASEPPSSVREFEFGLENPAYNEWVVNQKRAGAPSTKVDVHAPTQPMIGTIPPGFVAVPDGAGKWTFEKIPGGPAADEAAAAAEKKAGTVEQKQQMSDIVTGDIQRALEIVSKSPKTTTGIGGQLLSSLGGTDANDVRALVQTIRANVGFDQLQEMRANSPTGGALGPVSDAENALLQSVKGNLELSQTQEQFEYNLKRLNDTILDIVHGPGNGGPRLSSRPAGAGNLKSKYGLE